MNIKDYINLLEYSSSELMSYWDIAEHYGVDEEPLHDATIPWINYNQKACINRCIKNPNMVLLSKIKYYFVNIINAQNFSTKITTITDFEASLDTNITLWRGGGGIYNPSHPDNRKWVSFTADRKRVATFSEYNGTYSHKGILSKRPHYWIVELTMKFGDILLYIGDQYGDNEVIVPMTLARKNAKVIEQT